MSGNQTEKAASTLLLPHAFPHILRGGSFHPRSDVPVVLFPQQGWIVVLHDRRPRSPLMMDIAITTFCEGGCPFCYMDASTHGQHAPARVIEEAVGELEFPPVVCTLGGGEPTTHPELRNIIESLSRKSVLVSLTTGRGMDRQRLYEVSDLLSAIGISVWEDVAAVVEAIVHCGAHKVVVHVPLFPHLVVFAVSIFETLLQKEIRPRAILALPPHPVGRGKSFSVPTEGVALGIRVLQWYARRLRVPLLGVPCWTRGNRHFLFNPGCGGQWGMFYNAVTQQAAPCSFLPADPVPHRQVQKWWDHISEVKACPLALPDIDHLLQGAESTIRQGPHTNTANTDFSEPAK